MKQVNALWRPLLGFINTDDIQQTAVDNDSVTLVVKKTNSYKSDLTNAFEGEQIKEKQVNDQISRHVEVKMGISW